MRTTPVRRCAVALVLTGLLSVVAACAGTNLVPAPGGSASSGSSPSPTPLPDSSPSAVDPSQTPAPTRPDPEPPPPTTSCATQVDQLSLKQRVGQLLMLGVTSTGLTQPEAAAVEGSRAGSAVLLGNSELGVSGTSTVIDDVRRAAAPPRGIGTMVAADQEGGLVQRLQGAGFTRIPPATSQAEWSDARLRRSAADWAADLDRAGVDANLAPVADVVPTDLTFVNAPIGQLRRGYGSSPRVVARKVTAFRRGMQESEVGTAVKHFPGLGRVRGNTDFTAKVVDSVTTRTDPALAGFRAAIDDDTEMVMVSSAYYARIDSRRRAAYSPVIISSMLRGDLDFSGVVISDDLSAVAMRDLPAGERAIRFVRAGGDLAIVGNAAEARSMAAALTRRAEKDAAFADRVTESAERVVALKARLGLAGCDR